ncbi:MAG: hypothetical protein ACYC5Y_07700 [Symbiobacteriia bacterium]
MLALGQRCVGTALAALLLLAGAPASASANGLPAVWSRAPGGAVMALQPDTQTTVFVLREQLRLDLRANDGRGPADIMVGYWLENGSPDPVRATVAFPVPPGVVPQVTVDGQPVEVFSPVEAPVGLEGDDLAVAADWLNPFTGRPYSLGSWHPEQPAFVRFQIPFQGLQQRDLAVRYSQDASWDRRSFIRPALRYDYLLLPARHWAGFGELFIEVLAPAGYQVQATVPLPRSGTLRMEGGKPMDVPVYQAHLTGLPDVNLSVFLAPALGDPLFYLSWWWSRSGRVWLLAALALLGGLMAGWLHRDRSRKWRRVGGWLVLAAMLGALYLLTRENMFDPNPIGTMTTWFIFLPFTWVFVLGGWDFARRGCRW